MTRVVLSGSIGAGKSTVGRLLAERGAEVVDADRVGHEVLESGGAAFHAVEERWPHVVVDGEIDRARLAGIVFSDRDELQALEAITHPAIRDELLRRAEASDAAVFVVEVPVLREWPEWTRVVVLAPADLRRGRAEERGMSGDDFDRRDAAQATAEAWREVADVVIENDGSLDDLEAAVDDLWAQLQAR